MPYLLVLALGGYVAIDKFFDKPESVSNVTNNYFPKQPSVSAIDSAVSGGVTEQQKTLQIGTALTVGAGLYFLLKRES